MKYHINSTKRLFLPKIFLFIIICNLILNVVTSTELRTNTAPPASGWFSSEFDLDRSKIPKNILLGVNIGGWSHQRYVVTIANILADRGYNITLAARGNFPQSSQFPKIKFFSLGEIQHDAIAKNPKFRKAIHGEIDEEVMKALYDKLQEDYDTAFLKFRELAEIVKPDLFFCDAFINDMCFDVAWLKKKPAVAIATSFAKSIHIPYISDPAHGCKTSMENESFWERFKCEIIKPFKHMVMSKTQIKQNKHDEKRASYGLPIYSDPFEPLRKNLFLIDTFFGFEIPMPLPPLYQEIGPVLPDYFPPLTPELEEFIASHERTMFVALGSVVFLSPENNAKLLQSIAESIENNIIDGVIWGNIKKHQKDFPPTITLSNGKIISTSDIFDNKDPNIYIASFAPQFSILNHNNTKIFLSHAGPGSIHESLLTGTPIITLPIALDQLGFADRAVLAGAALPLDKSDLRVNDVLNKIEQIQKDEQIQINVKKLQSLAIINSKRKYRAADLIEYTLHSSIMKQKDENDEGGVEKRVYKEWITPDTRMGFIRGNYLDVYAAALGIGVSILIGSLLILFIIGKLIIRKLLDNNKKVKNE